MNNIIYLAISTPNIINLILGITLGFFMMIILSCAILSKKLNKKNENDLIRQISIKTYNDQYLNNYTMKDKVLSSLLYEIKEVSKLVHSDKKYPLYELSINDLINALNIIQQRLKKLTSHPLCQDIKHIHISKLLSFEENITRPIYTFYKKKSTKALLFAYRIFYILLNAFNPIFYIKKILTYFMIKKGKKDILLIVFDYIGNTTYQIYKYSKVDDNDNILKIEKAND